MKGEVISAGALRHTVQVQRAISTPNELNEPEVSWQTIGETHAAIEPLTAREIFAAQQVQSIVSHRITTRHIKGLTAKMRFLFHDYTENKDRAFNLEGKTNVREVNRKLEFLVREEV